MIIRGKVLCLDMGVGELFIESNLQTHLLWFAKRSENCEFESHRGPNSVVYHISKHIYL